jgi:hypothetical protein
MRRQPSCIAPPHRVWVENSHQHNKTRQDKALWSQFLMGSSLQQWLYSIDS